MYFMAYIFSVSLFCTMHTCEDRVEKEKRGEEEEEKRDRDKYNHVSKR